MKKIYICLTVVFFLITGLEIYADALNIGYREFSLGQGRDEVKNIISKKYRGSTAKYETNGDILLSMNEHIKAYLLMDHKKILYKITVQMKYGDLTEIKKRLIEKYGQPNDFSHEEWDPVNKLYLMAQWLVEKRYSLLLWESYYCRNQRFIPCVIEVTYVDNQRKEIKQSYERGVKEGEKQKKLDKTYEGF